MMESDLSVFDKKNIVVEDGLMYYIIPPNYPLFKATKTLRKGDILSLASNKLYFFGLKNMNPSYIDEYEAEYGVIFEFRTKKEYKLVALDDQGTVNTLYQSAPENIQMILRRNYGYGTGIRYSDSGKDRELSLYICSLGKDGYAVHGMPTEGGGTFHTELMICKSEGVEYVGQVTDEMRIEGIIERGKIEQLGKRMEESRRTAKERKRDTLMTPSAHKMRLFDDDGDVNLGETPFRLNLPLPPHTPPSPHNPPLPPHTPIIKSGPKKRLFDDFGGSKTKPKKKTAKRKRTQRKSKSMKSKKRNRRRV